MQFVVVLRWTKEEYKEGPESSLVFGPHTSHPCPIELRHSPAWQTSMYLFFFKFESCHICPIVPQFQTVRTCHTADGHLKCTARGFKVTGNLNHP
jgi:hypothetical protein